jgi:hypothetical protein
MMENNVLYLKISLDFIKPEIYRRIMFPARMTLLDLHHIIQYCFGWEDQHLFIFTIKDMAFVNSSDWEEDAYRYQDAGASVLADLIPKHVGAGDKFSYEYDLGDGWRHTILVEKLATDEEDLLMPVCVDGKRAGPLEDFGGPFMYQMYLENRQSPQNSDFINDMVWIPEDFDPERIDIGKINKKISRDYPIHTLEHESSWVTEVSYYSPFGEFSSDWTKDATDEEKKYAEQLPFRRDMVTMLNYLQNHRVKGTKATGNFPLKHIRALTAQFVNPPVLDEDLGGRIYKLRTEDDVPDLVFIHNFANFTQLILGGEDLEWHLSFLGENFLNQAPHEQAWYMVKSWFERLNWFYWYPWADYEDLIGHNEFEGLIVDILLSYPTQEEINIKQLIKDLDKKSPNWIRFPRREDPSVLKKYFLINVVLDPMNKLGIIQMEREDVPISPKYFVFDFKVTDFGQSIIQQFNRKHR